MKQCILLAISLILLLGMIACSVAPEEGMQEERGCVVAAVEK